MKERKNSKNNVLLTERDRCILHFLFEQKVALQKTISMKFFPNVSKPTYINRLQKLVRNNYIDKSSICKNGNLQVIYSLSNKGFLQIRQRLNLNGELLRLKSDAIIHDCQLSEIRLVLENFKMVDNYYPENFIQCCLLGENTKKLLPYRKLNSDAALKITGKSGSLFVALEYERSLKNRNAYAHKFLDYYLNTSIAAVLYLCDDSKIENMIKIVDKEVSERFRPKIFTINMQNINLDNRILQFKNTNNTTLNLK